MDRDTARNTVKGYLESYLQNKGIDTRKPFTCLNPDHPDRHPSMSLDRKNNRCKCFSCGTSYDIFDLIGLDYGLTEDKDKFSKAYELYGITIDNSKPAAEKKERRQTQPAEDQMEYIKQAQSRLTDQTAREYLKKRGISEATATKFWLGYDPNFTTQEEDMDGQMHFAKWRTLIIPTGKDSYVARNIDRPKEPAHKNRYRKRGSSQLFNSKALYSADKPIFITEGELDALSVIEAGGIAVALGSTSNRDKLVRLVEAQAPVQPLVLALDADKEGRDAEADLAEKLRSLNIPFYQYNPYGAAKDANEALLLDRDGFVSEVAAAERLQEDELDAIAEAEKAEYMKTSAAAALQDFVNGITERISTPAIKTGFVSLDNVLGGGIYKGLYFIGAVSSLGKTSLLLQIADNMAQAEQDVIVFSLEMDRNELIAKSISRQTYLQATEKRHAKTTRGILEGSRYGMYNADEKKLINSAVSSYKEFAQHVFIYEGCGDIGVEEVRAVVEKHIRITGKKPVVILDYLQILAPPAERLTDKQAIDKSVLELKRLSRDCGLPVLGISSFNRDNYYSPVNLTSFKESGAVEYSADVLIGLQYDGMDYREGEADGKRQKRIRELLKDMESRASKGEAQTIQAKILKNRNGAKGQALLNFYAMFNTFEEYTEAPPEEGDMFSDMRIR